LGFSPPPHRFLASRPGLEHPAVAIAGAPLDRTETFRPGTATAPTAVRTFSESLESYSPALDRDLEDLALADVGDLPLDGLSLDDALGRIADWVASTIRASALPVLIGGEHTLTLGAVRGAARVYPDLRVLQFDAHLDLIDEYAGARLSHATWLRRLCEELGTERVVHLGGRSGTAGEWRFARQLLYQASTLELPPAVWQTLARGPVYLTIDIDVLDPAAAPGTGCPEPGGVSFRELAEALYRLAELPVVGCDVVEVLPAIDPAGITAVAAAKLIRELVLLFAPHR
jgi:agmatinase